MQDHQYDYIITGAGCAGLSLAMHLLQQPLLAQKRILLIDESAKDQNDRTWCFWETGNSLFDAVVSKQWNQLWFQSNTFSRLLSIAPYHYKMIRGLDFYHYCHTVLRQQPSVHFLQAKVERIFSSGQTGVVAGGQTYTARYVFNSILFEKPTLGKKDIWLLQHFKGWLVKTPKPAFHPDEATLMDFRVSQQYGTAFCYVLPVSTTEALVEYTLFTPALLTQQQYDEGLQAYLQRFLHIADYSIQETEFGIIPMTNYRFPVRDNNIVQLGTAGGQTKGSSGYTFYFIQQHCKAIVQSLATNGHPFVAAPPARFPFYDKVLLQVLAHEGVPGHEIFTTLFQKNKPQDVLAFLNNASSLPTEIKIIATLPTRPFFKAAVQQLW